MSSLLARGCFLYAPGGGHYSHARHRCLQHHKLFSDSTNCACRRSVLHCTFCVQSVEILKAFFSSKSRRPFFCGYNFQRFHEAMCRLFARRRKLPGQPPENGEIENRFVKKKNVFFFSTWLIDFDLKRLTQSWGVRTFGKILRFLRNRKMCYDAPPKWKSSTMRQVFWSQPLQSLIAICQTVFFYHWEVCNVGLHGCILLRMFRTVTVINYYLLGCECPPCAGAKPRPWQACFWPKCFKTEQRCEDVRQCWVMFEVQTVKTAMVMTVVRVERPPGCGRVSLTWLTGPWTGWTGWSLGQLHRSGIQITSVTSTILSSFRQLGLQEGNSQVLREGLWEFWLLGNGQNEELAEFPCGCID